MSVTSENQKRKMSSVRLSALLLPICCLGALMGCVTYGPKETDYRSLYLEQIEKGSRDAANMIRAVDEDDFTDVEWAWQYAVERASESLAYAYALQSIWHLEQGRYPEAATSSWHAAALYPNESEISGLMLLAFKKNGMISEYEKACDRMLLYDDHPSHKAILDVVQGRPVDEDSLQGRITQSRMSFLEKLKELRDMNGTAPSETQLQAEQTDHEADDRVFSYRINRAKKLFQCGAYDEAYSVGEELKEKHPDLGLPLLVLGRIDLKRGNTNRAKAYIERALQLEMTYPEKGVAFYNLAGIARRSHDTNTAIRLLQEGLQVDPEDKKLKEFLESIEAHVLPTELER